MYQNDQNNQSNPINRNNQKNRSFQNSRSFQSTLNNQSNQSSSSHHFLPKYGHYRHLRVYKIAEELYDLTYIFCQRFLPHYGDRTVDQMVQAARSGKQNIAEGNQAASTSSETEIKLTNVAKASIEELLADYEDYLRTRNLSQWDNHHPRLEPLRQWTCSEAFHNQYKVHAERMNDEEMANLCITLCHQVIHMLHRLIDTMQDRFVTQGGIKERMHAARTGFRQEQDTRMEALQHENDALRQQIRQLEERLNLLQKQNKQ